MGFEDSIYVNMGAPAARNCMVFARAGSQFWKHKSNNVLLRWWDWWVGCCLYGGSGWWMTRTTPQGCTVPLMHIKHKNPRFTLLFSHGNAEDIGVNKLFCEWLSAQARCLCVCVCE